MANKSLENNFKHDINSRDEPTDQKQTLFDFFKMSYGVKEAKTVDPVMNEMFKLTKYIVGISMSVNALFAIFIVPQTKLSVTPFIVLYILNSVCSHVLSITILTERTKIIDGLLRTVLGAFFGFLLQVYYGHGFPVHILQVMKMLVFNMNLAVPVLFSITNCVILGASSMVGTYVTYYWAEEHTWSTEELSYNLWENFIMFFVVVSLNIIAANLNFQQIEKNVRQSVVLQKEKDLINALSKALSVRNTFISHISHEFR